MKIRFGPAGLEGVKEAVGNLEKYKSFGLSACEIAFTYGVYIKDKEKAREIGKAAERLGIQLSIHAPYWINLNSKERKKVQQSKERILRCCEIGDSLGAERIVFHPGYYSDMDKEETYQNIKARILEIQKEIKKDNLKIKIAAETTGKKNVFGSVDEILRLVQETKISFCLDFAHIKATEKEVDYKEILEKFKNYDKLHIHFSGIEFGEKGEKRHTETDIGEIKNLLKNLRKYAKNKEITIINESPNPIKDSVKSLELFNGT